MGKSLGNFITLEELFTGSHKLLQQVYSPMTIRFFILQAQYRSTLDFSNEALQAAEKGLSRLMAANRILEKINPSEKSTVDVNDLNSRVYDAMNDDLNSPIAIAVLFDWVRNINSMAEGKETITLADLDTLKKVFRNVIFDILGLTDEQSGGSKHAELTSNLIDMLLNMRIDAKTRKDFATSDKIRDELAKLGVIVRDRKDGFDWEIN
jgi:cysteinyl-tRNA synthetase